MKTIATLLCFMLTTPPLLRAQAIANLQIRADQTTARIPPNFYGLMTEEINYSYEGGLYGELVRNRNFKEAVPARRNPQNPNQPAPAKEPKSSYTGRWCRSAAAPAPWSSTPRHP